MPPSLILRAADSTSGPETSSINETLLINLLRVSATGARESDLSRPSGRPRCEIKMIFLAPALRRYSRVGKLALMRRLFTTLPFLIGTL